MAACRHLPLDLVADGLHQVGLAHADAAIEEQWVVRFRRTLSHSLAGRVGKLVAAADHECIEGVARVQLRGAVPVKARLRNHLRARKPAIVTYRSCRGIAVRHELHVLIFQRQDCPGLPGSSRRTCLQRVESQGWGRERTGSRRWRGYSVSVSAKYRMSAGLLSFPAHPGCAATDWERES